MRFQTEDLEYGYEREMANQNVIAEHLGVKLEKLCKYSIMDWKEVQEEGDETSPWWVEQKARRVDYDTVLRNFSYKGRPTVLLGKNKLEYMKNNGGNGVVYIDFTDKLMFWVFDEDEYKTFDVELKFKRNARADCIDKYHPVVHIPLSYLKTV
jgi:hypothetical protein